jgi:uncharacterized damage-inducible protein DinB
MQKLLLTAMALAIPAFSQTTLSTKDALVKHWKVTADFTMAVADKMPADSYSFRPVPEELSFGQLVIQIAVANVGACAMASGQPRPPVPEALSAALKDEKINADKATAMKYLGDTFKFCNDAVASITPEKLDAVVGASRKMSGFEWLWAYFTHTAHHRGQAEVYLRVKGIKPPDYTF